MKIKALSGLPPFSQVPTPQFNRACTESIKVDSPLEFAYILSLSIDTTEKAHEDEQELIFAEPRDGIKYWGIVNFNSAMLLGVKRSIGEEF